MAGAAGAGVNRQSIFAGSEDSVNEAMAGGPPCHQFEERYMRKLNILVMRSKNPPRRSGPEGRMLPGESC